MHMYRRHTTSTFIEVFLVKILQKYRYASLEISSSALVTPKGFHKRQFGNHYVRKKTSFARKEPRFFFCCWKNCIWMLRNLNLFSFVTCHWQVALICDRTGERGLLRDCLQHGPCSICRCLIRLHETLQEQLWSTHETHYVLIPRNGASV